MMSRLQMLTLWLLLPASVAAWLQSGFAWGEWLLVVSVTVGYLVCDLWPRK